jgi:regulator of sigma E protease
MSEFFGSVWWLIVSLGILVTFHEYGHYWVARRCGVKVLKFSVGFGQALWKRVARDGTEWVVAWIPLGGYVKMLDSREVEVSEAEMPVSFNAKPVGQRIAIVAAGPLANLLLCIALLWLMFVVGKPDFLPVVGRADGIAEQAGFRPGDTILRIGERDTPTWTEATVALATAALDREAVDVRVRTAAGEESLRRLHFDREGMAIRESQPLFDLGLLPRQWLLPAVVGSVDAGSAAEGRVQPGDRILAVDGQPILGFDQISPRLQAWRPDRGDLTVDLERNGQRLSIALVPRRVADGERERWLLGIRPQAAEAEPDALLRYGPLAAVPAALAETRNLAVDTLGMLWHLVRGRASLENISGPITIARVANASAQQGMAWFCYFLALLSLSLCIMNLLPIPVLDGGHLLYYLIELVKGSPVSERALAAGQYVGLALLAGLMGLAFYNDIFARAF